MYDRRWLFLLKKSIYLWCCFAYSGENKNRREKPECSGNNNLIGMIGNKLGYDYETWRLTNYEFQKESCWIY
jgi:hypothetical protein